MLGQCQGSSARAVPGQCQGSASVVLGQCQGSARVLLGQCQGFARVVPRQCQGSARVVLGQYYSRGSALLFEARSHAAGAMLARRDVVDIDGVSAGQLGPSALSLLKKEGSPISAWDLA